MALDRSLQYIGDPRHKALLRGIMSEITVLQTQIAELQAAVAPSWIDLVMQNSWVSLTGYEPPQYWRDADNWVHLKGTIQSGTILDGTVISSLPATYRPNAIWSLPIADGGRIEVQPGGDLVVQGLTDNTALPLSGVFYATR